MNKGFMSTKHIANNSSFLQTDYSCELIEYPKFKKW